MKGVFVFAITGLIIFSSLSFDDRNLAHAEYDGFGNYFCGESKNLEEEIYWSKVTGFNRSVEERSGSIEDLNNGYMKEGGGVEDIGKMAECLKEEHNVEPDSVIMISDKGQEVLSYDMEKLFKIAPGLAKYATVPEFGSITMLVLISGMVGTIYFFRAKFH